MRRIGLAVLVSANAITAALLVAEGALPSPSCSPWQRPGGVPPS